MESKIRAHRDLDVYAHAFDSAMKGFEASKVFPAEGRFSLTDQVSRSSRSVCANLAEGWRKRRYEAAFISKLSDAETEAAETQVWIEFAVACQYMPRDVAAGLYRAYDRTVAMLVSVINQPEKWVIRDHE
jgi:four helix bundle protein